MFYADLIARMRACMLRAWIFISTLSGWSRTLVVFALTAIWKRPYALWIWRVDSNLHWKWLWLIEFEWFPFNILYNILIRHNAIEHISSHEYTNILSNSNQYIFKWDCTRQTYKVKNMSIFSKITAIEVSVQSQFEVMGVSAKNVLIGCDVTFICHSYNKWDIGWGFGFLAKS